MAYTHIQCIGYRVPTVAKVADANPPPNAEIIEGINELDIDNEILYHHNDTITDIEIYDIEAEPPYYLSDPSTLDDTIDNSEKKAWDTYMKEYMVKCIKYVRSNDLTIPTAMKITNIITFIKYYMGWGKWTIPSKTTADNDVEILKVNANGDITSSILNTNDAYTLQGSDGYFVTNTNYVDALTPDARNRIVRFLNVLYMASKRREISSNESTLKVFMAPEFYFRPEAAINNDS
ncbi:MAG: hypothetical protein AAF934_03570, partial [Bacteroidota bacterium]